MRWYKILILLLICCFSLVLSGQKAGKKSDKIITITGKVLNHDQKPVVGAIFYIDNIRTNYKSNSNGSFKLKVSSSANKLMVLSSEFGSGEVLINSQTRINFVLNGNGDNLGGLSDDDIIEKDFMDAGEPVKQRSKKMNTYNDIYQMIRGEVNGVIVSGKNITIRQGHSFIGSAQPLFVVNGAIVNNIDFISPVDVKSISVLKGSSAAIYGIRGSNGVINITLLNGTEQ